MPLTRAQTFALLLCTIPALTRAQEPATISVTVRVVAFDAIVCNREGEFLHGLTKNDFTLTEDGKPQPIRYFSEDNNLPLTVGLVVDTSDSQRPFFDEQRIASRAFLTNMLTRSQDDAFVFRFGSDAALLQGMTSNLADLESALNHLQPTTSTTDHIHGTVLFDAICDIANNVFSKNRGRRAVVILTDGEDSGSAKTRDEAVACAQSADISVYTALYSNRDEIADERFDPHVPVFPHEHLPGRTNMERISRATGGRVFVVNKKLPIERIYAQIEDDLRSQYRLGYTPPPSQPGSYHALELRPLDKRSKVQTRIGYYTPK